ncbi:hypothetical protein JCM1840_006514 [Sporobolomyces johnsonii]
MNPTFKLLALPVVAAFALQICYVYIICTEYQLRVASLTLEDEAKIRQCAKAYADAQCEASPLPALELMCAEWKTCMGRQVVVPRMRIVAKMMADVVNGFLDRLSWIAKTNLLVIITVGVIVYTSWPTSRGSPPAPPSPFPRHNTQTRTD